MIVKDDENPKPETTLQTLAASSGQLGGSTPPGTPRDRGRAAADHDDCRRAKELGIRSIGEIISWAVAGVDPHYMGIGPVPASLGALRRAGMKLGDIDHIEINEAFGGQYLAVERELNLDRSKVNVNGGAIALGHPLGATGARMTVALLRLGGTGLASACIGGGQGGALIVNSLE